MPGDVGPSEPSSCPSSPPFCSAANACRKSAALGNAIQEFKVAFSDERDSIRTRSR
jgi:hypothetical protein